MRKIVFEIDANETTCGEGCRYLCDYHGEISCRLFQECGDPWVLDTVGIECKTVTVTVPKRCPQCLAAEGLEGSGVILPRSTPDEAWQVIFRLERRVWRGEEDLRIAQKNIEELEYKNGWLSNELQRKSDDN